jgi:Transposase DDE domain
MDRPTFFEQFSGWLAPARIVELARSTRWLIRQGKIDAFEFLVGLVFGQMSSLGLSLSAHANCFTEPVKREAVHQRFHQRTVQFFRASFQEVLHHSLAEGCEPALTQALAEHFPAIHVVDSTSFDCPESLAKIFPGCGGAASTANCKVLLRYEYLRSQFEPLGGLLPGKRSDQGLAVLLPSILRAGELLLNDKGFLKVEVLRQIQAKGAYFLMPWCRSLSLWLAGEQGSRLALNLAQDLKRSEEPVRCWPQVYLGQSSDAPACRVVAFRLSPESAGRQRAALREAQRKQGRQPSAEALELAGWLILITNAPEQKLPTRAIGYLYRVRWQIELVFKQCKSVLRLHQTNARKNEWRVQCEIWARLLAAVVVFAWYNHLQAAAWRLAPQREISFAQVARQLQQNGLCLALALIQGGQRLHEEFCRLWRHLLHTTAKGRQRTRKTTWELLHEHWLKTPGA